ncbi:hypothetical protein ACKS0A_03022 [Histoplasma ohiense]
MFFQLFLGGMTENKMPSEKGSRESTSSSSALPPIVIIWYISFSRSEMVLNPSIKPVRRRERRVSRRDFALSRLSSAVARSAERDSCSATRRRYSPRTERSTEAFWVFSSRAAMTALSDSLLISASSSLVYIGRL